MSGLVVDAGSYKGEAYAALYVISEGPMAHVSVFAPQGYALDLGRAAGAHVGTAVAITEDPAGGGFPLPADGLLTVADPAAYASDPKAQACAPGPHAAAWKAALSPGGGGRPLDLAIFVDPAEPTAPAGTAFVLQACPLWPSTEVGVAHRVVKSFFVFIEQGVTIPTSAGRYPWSALVTPAAVPSLAAEPGRTFELRATLPFPRVLTLRVRHDPKEKTVVLSGRLTALGQPEANVRIAVLASGQSISRPTFVTTNSAGEYQLKRGVSESTEYYANVAEDPTPCTAPSSAPAGCRSETVTPPITATAFVVVRKATDPKLVGRARDRALARRAGLKIGDFPEGWEALPPTVPIDVCPQFDPDLSALTTTGEAWSPVFGAETTGAASTTAVYSSEAQAKTAFRKEAQLRVARCVATNTRDLSDSTIRSVGPVSFPRVGHQSRAFRVVAEDDRDEVSYVDLVWFRRGRVVVHMWVVSLDVPLDPLTRSLAAKLDSRARGG